jgi:hypothetical protein
MYATLSIVPSQLVDLTSDPIADQIIDQTETPAETQPARSERNRRKRPDPAFVKLPDGSIYRIDRLTMRGESNAKMAKNGGKGYVTIGIAMLPHRLSGYNVCHFASKGCIKGCLNVSGRTMAATLATDKIMRARMARTILYFEQREKFLEMLTHEIDSERAMAQRLGMTLIIRPNVLSDIDWAKVHRDVVDRHPDVIWYGYSKNPYAMERWIAGQYPSNYYLTFSRSEENEAKAVEFLARGYNVSVIFDTKYTAKVKRPLPAQWKGFPVIDGDETDLRFEDPRGVVIGLRAKGRLRQRDFQDLGFVVRTDQDHAAPRVID